MATKVFFWPDIHWGCRDKRAMDVALQAFYHFEPKVNIFLGDLIDCTPFAKFAPTTMKETTGDGWVKGELEPAVAFLQSTMNNVFVKRTVFIEGNHEARIEKACSAGGRAMRAVYPLVSPKLHFSRFAEYIPWSRQRGLKISKDLYAIHGWTTQKHAARGHLERSRSRSVIYGHTHRFDHVAVQDPWSGKRIEAMSPGCLCELYPVWAKGGAPMDWTHGFAVAYIGRKSYTMYPVGIQNGSCVLPDGTEIK